MAKRRSTRARIDGHQALLDILKTAYAETDDQKALRKAILDNCYFIHPDVVKQTENLPILRARRIKAGEKPDTVVKEDFVSLNRPPHEVFCAATTHIRGKSTHLSHIYGGKGEARDPFLYSNLANLCLLPAFLAKLSDTDKDIVKLLKECAFVLYKFNPKGEVRRDFNDPTLTPKTAARLSIKLATALGKKKSKTFLEAKEAGFLFGTDGEIQRDDDWVREMIRLRDAIPK